MKLQIIFLKTLAMLRLNLQVFFGQGNVKQQESPKSLTRRL